jgi:hypothetical protein
LPRTSTTVTLTAALDPARRIAANKNLREATRPPAAIGGQCMGLRDSVHIVDALCDQREPQTIEVWNVAPLRDSFEFSVAQPQGIDKALVLDFVLDALATADPASAYRILALSTYGAVKAALEA